ncbi:MAG TPA: PstS family phosphate ABC transporter substrate-binding protein [Sphingobacteriaceae bacterium]|nr:PstS family phosphate ABC transporter substrate-binding protein [Sphingobacteriaceae bacterium]
MKSVSWRTVIPALLAIAGLVLVGCGAQDPGQGAQDNGGDDLSGYIDVRGSDTMVNLGQSWAEAFMDRHGGVQIAVTGGGSGTGIAQLLNNNTHIAQASRPMKPEEFQEAAQRGVDVHEFIVGQDGVVIAVHRDNPIDRLTVEQLKGIFTGRITHWSELGWEEGGAISIHSRDASSGTHAFVVETVMDGKDWAEGTRFATGSAAINEALRTDTAGIGYFGVAYVEGTKALAISADGGQNYYDPLNEEHVDAGLYPLARPLFFYTNGAPQGAVLAYLEWVLGDEGQSLLEEIGFFKVNTAQTEQNEETFKKAGLR